MSHTPRPLRAKFWTPGVVLLAFLMAEFQSTPTFKLTVDDFAERDVLAWTDFSFKVGCPNPFDCGPADAQPATASRTRSRPGSSSSAAVTAPAISGLARFVAVIASNNSTVPTDQ